METDEPQLEILLAILEILFEAVIELGAEAATDLLSRAASHAFKHDEPPHPVASGLALTFLGALIGAASVFFLPHPLFHRSRFHGISLIVSPVAAGLAMSALGATLRKHGKQTVQIESFLYAFLFALGMAFARLFWTR